MEILRTRARDRLPKKKAPFMVVPIVLETGAAYVVLPRMPVPPPAAEFVLYLHAVPLRGTQAATAAAVAPTAGRSLRYVHASSDKQQLWKKNTVSFSKHHSCMLISCPTYTCSKWLVHARARIITASFRDAIQQQQKRALVQKDFRVQKHSPRR